MKTKFSLVLAIGLLQLCSGAMAAQDNIQADGFMNGEFAWLVGAVILGLCVIARRRPLPHSNREAASEASTSTGRTEQWETSGAAS